MVHAPIFYISNAFSFVCSSSYVESSILLFCCMPACVFDGLGLGCDGSYSNSSAKMEGRPPSLPSGTVGHTHPVATVGHPPAPSGLRPGPPGPMHSPNPAVLHSPHPGGPLPVHPVHPIPGPGMHPGVPRPPDSIRPPWQSPPSNQPSPSSTHLSKLIFYR